MTQAFRTDIQVRFNDTDAFGHLNNTAFALYAEQARVDFLSQPNGDRSGLILAHIALDFRQQVRWGEAVYVLTTVEKIGNSSVTLKQEVYADDVLAVEVRSVVVFFDYAAQKPKTIPDALRAKLTPPVQADT